jgi:hypothetical protein
MSWKKHYEKKYPGGRVQELNDSLDVWNSEGEHCVALRKDGHGNLVCRSAQHEAKHAHDLAPMPAKVKPEHVEGGRVKSCHEIGAHLFDDKQRAVKEEE